MAIIQVQKKAAPSTHSLVITNKWKNHTDYGFSKEEVGYLDGFFKDESKKTLSYNSNGRIISVLIIDTKRNADLMAETCRRHGGALAEMINGVKGKELSIFNSGKVQFAYACAEGAALANYQFIKYIVGAKDKKNSLEHINFIGAGYETKVLNKLNIVVEATCKARDLVNEPVNHLNATDLANAFKQMGKQAGFKVDVYNKKKIQELNMGGLLAVNAGSVDEPTFTIMEYKPRAKNKKPFVIVGKGVTYDTGGLSLKPTPNSMDLMKCDMAGAAAVGAAMYAIAKARLNVHVIGIVPATDNRPGFNAFAPGDIITMMDGTTVEMVNSDAEGRMILADALHFAKKYKPELAIDIATLTGAAMAAIGTNAMVGMGNASKKYSDQIKESGHAVHERVAEFPFWEDYGDMMKSDIADQKNLAGGYAGAIQGGKFLEKFTDYPYYHLDIAGPAFITAKDGYRGKGATGVGVRLFFDFFNSI
jgi:leucyl aminopeptidase